MSSRAEIETLERYIDRTNVSLDFWVFGIPAPQGSKRFLGVRGGKGIVVESSKRTAPWRSEVAQGAIGAMGDRSPAVGPILLTLAFWLPRPKSHFGVKGVRPSAPHRPAGKPDLDKLARAALDAMTGVVWRDDSQVTHIDTTKSYTDGRPGLHVMVYEAV